MAMKHKRQPKTKASKTSIKAIGERFAAYLDREWRGNQSALAAELAVSQPAISRVAAGDQPPSGKLLMALAVHTSLNFHWLFTGAGDMLRAELAMPVARQPLPGPLAEHSQLLKPDSIKDLVRLSATQYFLELQSNDPIVHADRHQLKAGDLLLMQTDRALFPDIDRLLGELCVVRVTGRGAPAPQTKLAEIEDFEDEFVFINTFDIDPNRADLIEKIGVVVLPGGKLQPFRTSYRVEKARINRLVPVGPMDFEPYRPAIAYADILAVRLITIRR
jgi:hypothetical protein